MVKLNTPGRAKIIGTGHCVPQQTVTNFDLERMVQTTNDWIVAHTGIQERRIATVEMSTSDLAFEAGRRAIAKAGVDPAEIDVVLLASITPDYPVLSMALDVSRRLGCERAIPLDLGQLACAGFVYGMVIADHFLRNPAMQNVLLICADAMSRIIDWEDRTTCVFFGDAAGAVVVQRSEEGAGLLDWHLDGEYSKAVMIEAGGARTPLTPELFAEKRHCLDMDGRAVWEYATRAMPESITEAARKAEVTLTEIDWFLFHQANLRIIEACMKKLEQPMSKTYTNVHRYGNVSGATIPVLLSEAVEEGMLKPGDLIAFSGIGAGLLWGSLIYRWGELGAAR